VLDPRPQIDVFALDVLGGVCADSVLLGGDMPLVGTLAVGVEADDAKRLQQYLQASKDVVLAPSKHIG
jgi:hypothetical protein